MISQTESPLPSPEDPIAAPARAALPTLYVCGVNHERADLGMREKFALSAEQCTKSLGRAIEEDLAEEAMILSTCNRTEVYAFAPRDDFYGSRLRRFFLSLATTPLEEEHAAPVYDYNGVEAVRHLFAVTSGLDSMILGENEIKGQVGHAFEISRAAGAAGPNLHRLIEWSNRCAKRIKTETELNVGTLCFGKASVLRAEEVLGGIEGRVCVVIGAGEVGRAAAIALSERQPARLIIINRTPEHAAEVAKGLKAEVIPIPQMAPAIRDADLIIGAAFAPNFLVTRAMFQAIRPSESARKVCLIDAAVPRILDHEIGTLAGVTRLDISDLEEIIAANRQKRVAASRRAWELVEEKISKFQNDIQGADLGPWIARLKERFDEVFAGAEGELEAHAEGPGLEKHRAARQKLKQKLLHEVIAEFKRYHNPPPG